MFSWKTEPSKIQTDQTFETPRLSRRRSLLELLHLLPDVVNHHLQGLFFSPRSAEFHLPIPSAIFPSSDPKISNHTYNSGTFTTQDLLWRVNIKMPIHMWYNSTIQQKEQSKGKRTAIEATVFLVCKPPLRHGLFFAIILDVLYFDHPLALIFRHQGRVTCTGGAFVSFFVVWGALKKIQNSIWWVKGKWARKLTKNKRETENRGGCNNAKIEVRTLQMWSKK